MARRTVNYWKRRAEARLIAIERGTEPYLRRIYQLNLGVVDSIREDIERIIGNFAKHSQLTREEAISLLGETITEMERQRIIAMCSGIEDKATKARLMAKVNAPAYRARIDRLLAIEVSAQARMALLAPRQIDTMTTGLHKAGLEMYSRTMFDLQRGTGLGFSFAGVTDKQIESVMREPWSGGHYSNRVWRNTQIVAERIRDTVEKNMITGKSWRRCLNTVEDQALIDSNYAASRIMRTETAYVANEMEALAYEEAGLEEYQYVATLDARTSTICQELDGKKFKLKDRETGKNYPPMHPHCRSTTVAVIKGFDMSELQRRARDPETGETYKVPANMKYEEWYQKHVVDTGKEWSVKATRNSLRDLEQHESYKSRLGSEIPRSFKDFQKVKYQNSEKWSVYKAQYRGMGHYEKAIVEEPRITENIKRVAKTTGMNPVGLEHRIKTKDSFLRKIETQVKQGRVDYEVKDIVRYTLASEPDSLAAKTLLTIEDMRGVGYNTVEVKNSWLDKKNPYKGINTTLRTETGLPFEVQYHTPESFELKNGKLHELYEEARLLDVEDERYLELQEEMFKLSDKLERPKDVEKVR